MRFCSMCGKEVVEEAVICPNCGCQLSKSYSVAEHDAPNTGWAVLGFFIPIVGLILYLINKDKTPQKAKSAGKGALIGFIVSVVFSIVYGAIAGAMIGSIASSYSYYY